MVFKLRRTGDDFGSAEPYVKNAKVHTCPGDKNDYFQTIEINSLEDLKALQNEARVYDKYVELIINFPEYFGISGIPIIEIYDTWRE